MTSVLIPLVVITALILLNGVFVAAEFAIVGAPRAAIEHRAGAGDRIARMMSGIRNEPQRMDRFVATAQLGITGASLGLGMYGEHILAGWLVTHMAGLGESRWIAAHSVASVVSVAILTYFHIVIGEMVPKALALQQPERTARWITPPMRVVQAILYPLVVALNGVGNGLLKLFGINRQSMSAEQYRTAEEIDFIVRESQAGGLIRKESAQVIQELLEFADLAAGDVMVPRVRVVGIPLGASASQLRETLRSSPHTRYPVYDGAVDRIVGQLHIKDILRRLPSEQPVTSAQVRPIPFVPETAAMDSVLAVMRQSRSQMAVVMDEHGGTAGVITIEDLFEEVVGDIPEESGTPPEMYVGQDGRLHVAGTVRLEEVGAGLGVVLEHEDVTTVSGLILSLLGRPPVAGDVVVYDDVRFEVRAVVGHGVHECVATLLQPPTDEEEGG